MRALVAAVLLAGLALWISTGAGDAGDGSSELSLTVPAQAVAGGEFAVSATLSEHGTPLAFQELVFARETTFGALVLARASTNASGHASTNVSIASTGVVVLSVTYAGNATLRSSIVTSSVVLVGPAPPAPDYLAILSTGIVVAAVVGSVWACYAYVLTQLWEIRREGRRASTGHGGSVDRR